MFKKRGAFPLMNAMQLTSSALHAWGAALDAPERETNAMERTIPAAAPRAEHAPAAPAEDERTLCARALAGDVAAWNALVAKHDHRVVVSLLARGVRVDRAKDIAQEAWMRLVEQQRGGRLTHLSLPGLAIAQAAFLSLEAARRDGSRGEPLSIHDPDGARATIDLADPAADAESRLLTSERVAAAEKVLEGCSPSARAVFRLAYGGEGLAHADVAKKVGLSLQRVRQILCEVRAKLRDALEGEEP